MSEPAPYDRQGGYSLVEIVVAFSVGLLLTSSAFLFLEGGSTALAREPKVAELNGNVRWALDRVSGDLTGAGVGTPSEMALLWRDGERGGPDAVTILFADAEFPIARPRRCAGACNPLGASSELILDPQTMSPLPADYETAYARGTVLFALQSALAGAECAAAPPALVWFELTDAPRCSNDPGGTSEGNGCIAVSLTHGPIRALAGEVLPAGIGSVVDPACAFVGAFHAVQYRLDSGELQRRDLFRGEDWSPVAADIDDFQLQYMQGFQGVFADAPSVLPSAFGPSTWLTAVRITVSGASGDEPTLRRSLSTTVSLRNQLGQASVVPAADWN